MLNADLAESNYPVMVGHYQGSTIAGGESRLDEAFDGALTRRMQMNVYPGAPGTVDFVSMPHKRPRGAVIAGLGETHALRPEHVRSAVLKAALHYANALAEKQEDAEVTQWQSAAFSCLLIGTRGSEPLNASASVAAIVQAALEANRGLRANGLWDRVRIDSVQFVEIYEDVAIEAAHAIAALPGSLLSLMEEGERISPAELLDVRTGSRPQRPFDLYDAGWWRRIQIECKEKNGRQRYLKYVVTTDRARAEETGSVTQITMLDHFVAAAIGSPSFDRTLATALYSALLPNRIKEQLRDRADLVLELDRDAAQYPWELLTPVSAVEAEPLVTTLGLIRQFKTSEFEQRPRTIAAKKALVIGDPLLDEKTKLKFRELKGAREEAYLVQKLLETNGYAVTPVIQKGAHDAFLRLYSEEFKVLHLAGHGVFDDNGVTGMVLGDGLFLTAEDLNNLAFVPELAFLNCCHLARVGEEEPDLAANRQRLQSVNRLAASVAEALIKKGAKAVVAAGWAVSDAAALTFAEKLYGLLLDDQPFGRAVLEARKEVFRRHKRRIRGALISAMAIRNSS